MRYIHLVKHKSIRILLAIVATFDPELEQMDVKTAFLHGSLDEVISIKQPQSFEVGSPDKKVCLLKRSLYGLKQSPRQWYLRLDEFMMSNKFGRSAYDWCVYFKRVRADVLSTYSYM